MKRLNSTETFWKFRKGVEWGWRFACWINSGLVTLAEWRINLIVSLQNSTVWYFRRFNLFKFSNILKLPTFINLTNFENNTALIEELENE